VFDGEQVETSGNAYAHLVLRGGTKGPNYSLHDLYHARTQMREKGIQNPALLVDASHDNSRIDGTKEPKIQVDVVREVLSNLHVHTELRELVRGFLLESFLKTGAQALERATSATIDRGGLSVTDPCLGWERTAALLTDIAAEAAALRDGARRLRLSS
jgi:3-deoxy-7-phosphoheptulonate synthase